MTDERLENMLSKSMPQISPRVELNQQIMVEMDGKMGRRVHSKKMVVLAIACCLMLSSITVGAATIYYYTSTRTNNFQTKDYRKIDYAEEKMGCEIKFIRNFACGFHFDQLYVFDNAFQAMSENGEEVFAEEYVQTMICYSGNAGEIMLICSKDDRESIGTDAGNVRNIAGIDVKYETFTFDEGEIGGEITSVDGTEKEEVILTGGITHSSAQWIQDGVYYFLGSMPYSATEEELFSMVEELITSE